MTSEAGNLSVQNPKSSEMFNVVQSDMGQTYSVETRDVVGRPVRDNTVKDTDQMMGYLD